MPGETRELVEQQIRAILDQIAATDPQFQASLKTMLTQQPFEIAEDAPIVQTLLRQATRILGAEPGIGGAFGWMDSALLAAAGIPTVIFGPGGDGAHAVVEWSDLDQLQRCADVLVATIEEFCA